MKHTPGPWIIEDKTDKRTALTVRAPEIATISALCPAVAKVFTPRSWAEARANACLIATSPVLLAAAEKVIDQWEHGDLAEAVRELAEAVKQAKGGE